MLAEIAPAGSDMLLNATASLVVREALVSLPETRNGARLCEVALFGRGRGSFVLCEGKSGNPTIPDLMAHLSATVSQLERTLLFDPESGLTEVQIGQGCGSVTMQMSDARLSAMTAMATEEIIRLSMENEEPGQLVVGIAEPSSPSTNWRRETIGPFLEVPIEGGDGWNVRISPAAQAKIQNDVSAYPGVETGGLLIGCCSARLKTVTVVDVLPAPEDSQRSAAIFVLGKKGLRNAVLQRHKESGGSLLDVGTWHSHLMDHGPSELDRKTAAQLAAERAPPAILLIAAPVKFYALMQPAAD